MKIVPTKHVQVGDIVLYNDAFGDTHPDQWARVIGVDSHRFSVTFLDGSHDNASTDKCIRESHCTVYREPPDEFYVWQAKFALLGRES